MEKRKRELMRELSNQQNDLNGKISASSKFSEKIQSLRDTKMLNILEGNKFSLIVDVLKEHSNKHSLALNDSLKVL